MKIWIAHLVVIAGLFMAQYLLPDWQASNLARIMVLAIFAMGYNLAFGYTGLLSLGHALFLAAGMYAAALPVWHWGLSALPALGLGVIGGAVAAGLVGVLALRTSGVAFMIVTLMFAQSFHLALLYFSGFTGGDDGFAVPRAGRQFPGLDLTQDGPRYLLAWVLFSSMLVLTLAIIRSRFGRVMIALRENEERARMLGYNPYRLKLVVLVISGAYAGLAGGAYALLFGYAGASFATTQYSILPLLYTLLGGAGTVLGPLLGTALMTWLIDVISGLTSAWAFWLGAVLVALVLFAPKGVLGWLRARIWRDLP